MTNPILHKKNYLAAVLTGCFFMWACENDINEVRDLGRKKASVEEGRNIQSFLSMNGKMRARLTAPLLLRYQGDSAKKAEFPNSLHVDFFNDSLKIESQLNAKYGRYLENENKVFLRDNVIAFNIKGDTLFCEELYWDQTLEKFYTSKKVTIIKDFGRSRYTGLDGMTCKQDLSGLTIFNMNNTGSYAFIPDSTASTKPAIPMVPLPADTTKKKK